MIWLGIDPGAKGGFSQIRKYGNGQIGVITESWDSDEFVDFMRDVPTDMEEVKCAVEKVGAMPGQGVTGMFNFGKSFGFILGVLETCNIPYQLVPPATWKREFSLIGKDKKASIEVCKRLFPDVDLKRTDRCKTESDGMAESLLLALYAQRHF